MDILANRIKSKQSNYKSYTDTEREFNLMRLKTKRKIQDGLFGMFLGVMTVSGLYLILLVLAYYFDF